MMAWIEVIGETASSGELKEAYKSIASQRGKLSNIMRVHSLNPATMRTHMDLYLSVMFRRSGVSRPEREMIAAVVSSQNGCAYCVNHHEEALRSYWKNADRIRRVVRERDYSDLSRREVALLEYATKLTVSPESMVETDVESLREAGYSDRDILDITLVASYFNFVNRIAQGLGVTFDAQEMTGYNY